MPGGYEVDIGALVKAAEGVQGTLADLGDNKVSAIGGAGADYGNAALASAVAGFCSRWETGVQNLANDVRQVAARLYLSAVSYARAERENVATVSQAARLAGSADPAAPDW